MWRSAFGLAALMLLSSCSLGRHVGAAQLRVAHFHALLNAGNFDQIEAEADPNFSWPRRGPTFKDYLAGVHRKLGFCGSWRMLAFNERWGVTGGVVRLDANTHCDADNAQESFVFNAGDLKLLSYSVTSPRLVAS